MDFELKHIEGKLIAVVKVNGVVYEKDVTEYFESDNAFDDWLDYRIEQKYKIETLSKR